MPEVHLLSNGTYHVMVTAAGAGYSRCRGLAISRWREDATLDNWGTFCYLRDCADGAIWSTTLQPSLRPPSECETKFAAGMATFSRRDQEIEARTEIAVSLAENVEVRRVSITNRSERLRTLDATS